MLADMEVSAGYRENRIRAEWRQCLEVVARDNCVLSLKVHLSKVVEDLDVRKSWGG